MTDPKSAVVVYAEVTEHAKRGKCIPRMEGSTRQWRLQHELQAKHDSRMCSRIASHCWLLRRGSDAFSMHALKIQLTSADTSRRQAELLPVSHSRLRMPST
eukprot:TRINITY_DN64058_c0_g1_i4.p1 TRINITY_DN64058_c0_g1~~TRINITY_DN64058_c0_g1_i4.p1  ORF type:complete len:101 (-),score=3.87 TRINITY_DN64058_c0_g1_i4:72-374(-)